MIGRPALLSALLLAATACSATPGSPVPDPAVAALHDKLLHADPCGFLDPEVLRPFGAVRIAPDSAYHSCSADIGTPGRDFATASVRLQTDLSGGPQQPREVGGLTVYQDPDDTDLCGRNIVITSGVVVSLSTSQDPKPCAISDAITGTVVSVVHTGSFTPVRYPAGSLAWRDACTLLDAPHAAGAVDERHRSFGGHSCTWGSTAVSEPGVYVGLDPGSPPSRAANGDMTTIGGHPASMEPRSADAYPGAGPMMPACTVIVGYQPLVPAHEDWVERVTTSVTAEADGQSLCAQAIELATKVIARLGH